MTMHPLAVLIFAAILAGCAPASPTTVASPFPSPSAAAIPSPTSAAPVSPSPSPEPLNVAAAIGVIPRSFHYFAVGQGENFRILLFDEERALPPVVALTSGRLPVPPGPDVRSEAFTVSADGRIIVLMRRLSEQQTTYYLLRPETGEVRALLSGADLDPPVITADGSRIAFARRSEDPNITGLWLFAVALGAPPPIRLVADEPRRVGSPPQPVAWSDDGKWLAIAPGLGDSGTEIAVVDPSAGETRFNELTNAFIGGRVQVVGMGYAVDWRGGEHNLLITSTRTAFGGRTEIYTADLTSGATRSRYRPSGDVVLGAASFHPTLDRYAITEHPVVSGLGAPTAIWVRGIDGSATKVAESAFFSPPWWSRDGTKLFSITGGDDSTGYISNLLGTGGGTVFCKRGGTKPPCV